MRPFSATYSPSSIRPATAPSSSTFKLSSAQDSAAKDSGGESGGRDVKRSLAPSASKERGGTSSATQAQPRSLLEMKRDEIYDHVEGAVLDAGAASAELAAEDTSAEPPCAEGQADDSAAAPPTMQAAKVKAQRLQLLQRVGPGSTFVTPLSAPSDLGCASTFARALASSSIFVWSYLTYSSNFLNFESCSLPVSASGAWNELCHGLSRHSPRHTGQRICSGGTPSSTWPSGSGSAPSTVGGVE